MHSPVALEQSIDAAAAAAGTASRLWNDSVYRRS
jgi:hypothetical protein